MRVKLLEAYILCLGTNTHNTTLRYIFGFIFIPSQRALFFSCFCVIPEIMILDLGRVYHVLPPLRREGYMTFRNGHYFL